MTLNIFTALLAVLVSCSLANGRKWNDTGVGSIIFEEAVSMPYPELGIFFGAPDINQTVAELIANLGDIHNQRLTWMDETGVDYMVLSLTAPGIQGISDPVVAEQISYQVNNRFANITANNTMRFGVFAALSMHNATQAALELRRCVTELGFLGALINDYQQSGSDNNTLLYYDTPEYDPFWAEVVKLDVPIYLHPRPPIDLVTDLDYAHAPWINGAPHQFAVMLSNHIVGLCTNGIFDRFPDLRLVVGHLGERVPSDLWRIEAIQGLPMKQPLSYYWKKNIYETTTGNLWTGLLDFHRDTLGADRILYSVDYPFMSMHESAAWIKSLPYSNESILDLTRNNAIKLLKLDA